MPAVNAKNLQLMLEDRTKGPAFVEQHLSEAFASGQLVPEDFSIRDIFISTVPDGREMVEHFSPSAKRGGFSSSRELQEAADAVSSSLFANITGQLIYTTIMRQAQAEDYVLSRMVPNVQTNFSGEKIPGVANLADEAQIVKEGEEYTLAGFNEDWIETPQTVKRGNIVPVTKEAIFFDRTNLILSTAGQVGLRLGANKEKRLLDAMVDENTTAHRYKWRGTIYATYQASAPWINLQTSNALVDWTDIDTVEQLAANVTDPNTGEPMPLMLTDLVVTPQLRATAYRILSATNIAMQAGGFATSGNLLRSDSPSPLGKHEYSAAYNVVCSRLLAQRMATDTTWYLGRVSEALVYMQNWPITVEQAGADSAKGFERDIVAQYKASEMGAAFVKEPRYLFKSTVAA